MMFDIQNVMTVFLSLSLKLMHFLKLPSRFLTLQLFLCRSFFLFAEWTTRYLHIASAVCHGGSGAVCAASYLPIGPV